RAEDPAVFPHALEKRLETDRLGIEHRPAAKAREAVAGGPDDVDVRRPQGDAFLQYPESLVHERVEGAFQDLLLAVFPSLDPELPCAFAENLQGFGIVMPGAVARLVAIIALADLLAEASRFEQREVRLVVGRIRGIELGIVAVDVHPDVHARHVEDREYAHGHA